MCGRLTQPGCRPAAGLPIPEEALAKLSQEELGG